MKKTISFLTAAALAAAMGASALAQPQSYTDDSGVVFEYDSYHDTDTMKITGIKVPDGMTAVTIPAKVNGAEVGLVQINYPENNENIENVTEITLDKGIKTLQYSSFSSFKSLETVKLPDSLISLDDNLFKNCANLKNIEFPDRLLGIGSNCFSNCVSLESISLPKSLKSIGFEAFCGCENLANVEFDRSTDLEIDNTAFDGTKFIEEYPEEFFIINDGKTLYKYTGKSKTVEIPEGVESIWFSAFEGTDVETVVFPNSLKSVRNQAFFEVKSLKTVEFKGGADTIEESAFGHCENLKEVKVNGKIGLLKPGAFDYCANLETYIDADEIEPYAYEGTRFENMKPVTTDKPKVTDTPTATAFPASETTPEPEPTVIPTASPIPQTLTVEGGEEITVNVGGEAVAFPDAKPFIDENDRTQVPVRAVAEMLDCKVDWNGKTQTVTITKNGEVITLVIGEDVMTKNNEKVQMDTKAMIKDERTYIPVRFAAEALGLEVEYK